MTTTGDGGPPGGGEGVSMGYMGYLAQTKPPPPLGDGGAAEDEGGVLPAMLGCLCQVLPSSSLYLSSLELSDTKVYEP